MQLREGREAPKHRPEVAVVDFLGYLERAAVPVVPRLPAAAYTPHGEAAVTRQLRHHQLPHVLLHVLREAVPRRDLTRDGQGWGCGVSMVVVRWLSVYVRGAAVWLTEGGGAWWV
jgi:hypothetical protein